MKKWTNQSSESSTSANESKYGKEACPSFPIALLAGYG